MRRFLAILAGLCLLAALPSAATARPPVRETDHAIEVFCDGLTTTSGTGIAFVGVRLSDLYGPDAYFEFWADGTPDSPPDLSRDFGAPIDASLVAGSLTVGIPLIDQDGDPAGTLSLEADLLPAGDPFVFDEAFRDGNRQFRVSGTEQPLAVEGTAATASLAFVLDPCFGFETTFQSFASQPNSYVATFSDRSVGCALENAAGDFGDLFIDFGLGGDRAFVSAFMVSADGSTVLGAFGEIALAGGAGSGSLETYDPETGETLPGSATISLSLSGGDVFDFTIRTRNVRETIRGRTVDVEGTLSFPGGTTFDLGACIGQESTAKTIQTNPQGPKPTGKAPANDLPTGAQAIRASGRVSQQTKAASPDREAPYPCLSVEDPESGEVFEVPVGHTVWFSVQGTGGDVTIDTAGSSFDTVAAVYVESGAGLTPVACVDDVALDPIGFSLQSAVTFPTTAGTTYLVQIGGYPQGWPYGTLKVAVR
jgi:hypothetical protein